MLDYLITLLQCPVGLLIWFLIIFGQGCFVKGKLISHVRNVCFFMFTSLNIKKNPLRPDVVGKSNYTVLLLRILMSQPFKSFRLWGRNVKKPESSVGFILLYTRVLENIATKISCLKGVYLKSLLKKIIK